MSTGLVVVLVAAIVVCGLIVLIGITSWQNVQIARATGRDPRPVKQRPMTVQPGSLVIPPGLEPKDVSRGGAA